MALKKPGTEIVPVPGVWVCPDPAFQKKYPGLAEWMCSLCWEDGELKEKAGLAMKMEDDKVNLTLSLKTARLSVHTTGRTLEAALTAMEAYLQSGVAQWKPWKG